MTASARTSSPSTETAIGSERNLLKPTPEHARLIELKSPILTNEEFAKLKHMDLPGFKSVTFPILFKAADGPPGLEKAMDELVPQGQTRPSRTASTWSCSPTAA